MVIDNEWDRMIEEAFSGWRDPEKLSEKYKGFGEGIIKRLVREEHDISAYLALSAFIDELLNDIMGHELYTEDASNSERRRLRRIDTRSKADILRVTGVIDKKLRNQVSEFWKHRNDFAHEASNHIYSEKKEQTFKNAFKQGLRAYDRLLQEHPESFTLGIEDDSTE